MPSLRPFLALLVLGGLIFVAVGMGTGIPEILIAGLVMIFFMAPVIFLREMAIHWIRHRLGREDGQR